MKVSRWARIGRPQSDLDFVDVDPTRDTRLFVDPYAIQIKRDAWSDECARHIRSFFDTLLGELRAGNDARAEHLASHLGEAQETFLGLSRGRPQGRGVGPEQAALILDALRNSRAFQTGLLSELGETELFVEGVGPDKISDLTTNIIRGPLLSYTRSQAELWGMPLTRTAAVGAVWDPRLSDWTQDYRDVLLVQGRPVILVPKFSVRMSLSLNSQEFYNHYFLNFLQREYLQADRALVRVLQSGERRVYKKDVREVHPKEKGELARFAQEHPDILEQYKRIKGARGALDNDDLDEGFNEADYAAALRAELQRIGVGNQAASEYHRFCLGALTFLFYPNLIKPVKEREIDQGRKRIDISFTNAAVDGFFLTALQSPQMRAIEVQVECKNYRDDLQNPELDQICGRFSHVRGFLGLLTCRSFQNKARFIARAKDAAVHRGQYVIVLDDDDLGILLDNVQNGRRRANDVFLRRRLAELIN